VGLLGTRFTETAGLLGESGHGIVHALQQNRSSIAPLIWSAEESVVYATFRQKSAFARTLEPDLQAHRLPKKASRRDPE
jgi:hypothetical protein